VDDSFAIALRTACRGFTAVQIVGAILVEIGERF
jgi:hypothetical protein